MAICRPLTVPRRLSKMARAGWALLAIWLSSVLFSLPWLYYNKVSTYNYKAFRKVTKEEPNLFYSCQHVEINQNSKIHTNSRIGNKGSPLNRCSPWKIWQKE